MANDKYNRLNDAYVDSCDEPLSIEQIESFAWDGEPLIFPNTSGSDYTEVFKMCGAESVKVLDNTSSAADWVFAIKKNGFWFLAFQYNNWPNPGFSYSINTIDQFISFEALCAQNEWFD